VPARRLPHGPLRRRPTFGFTSTTGERGGSTGRQPSGDGTCRGWLTARSGKAMATGPNRTRVLITTMTVFQSWRGSKRRGYREPSTRGWSAGAGGHRGGRLPLRRRRAGAGRPRRTGRRHPRQGDRGAADAAAAARAGRRRRHFLSSGSSGRVRVPPGARCWRRCQAIVSASAPMPTSVSCLRRVAIASSTAWLVCRGMLRGRRDRGSNAASPRRPGNGRPGLAPSGGTRRTPAPLRSSTGLRPPPP
jgi:hypothetical protein